jgi:hypothetical protein
MSDWFGAVVVAAAAAANNNKNKSRFSSVKDFFSFF